MARLKILGINYERCIKCEKCISSCSPRLFSVEKKEMEKKIIFHDPYRFCFRCGHCLAVCPTEAINYEGSEPTYEFKEAEDPSELLSYEELLKLTRARRSIRVYKDKSVPKEIIEKVLEVMKYAPSASNRQNQRFLVITDKEKISWLSDEVSNLMKLSKRLLPLKYIIAPFISPSLRRRLKSPRTKKNLENFFERQKSGEDRIFFEAPVVVILSAPPYSKMTGPDAGISITHGMFAAQSLGLGTCWIGFAQEYLTRFKKIRRKIGIPKNHNVYGVFTLGYPDIKFVRAPPRRERKIDWITN